MSANESAVLLEEPSILGSSIATAYCIRRAIPCHVLCGKAKFSFTVINDVAQQQRTTVYYLLEIAKKYMTAMLPRTSIAVDAFSDPFMQVQNKV